MSTNLGHPDNESLQQPVAPKKPLPIICFIVADYVGDPEDARLICRQLAKGLSAECERLIDRDHAREKIRIVVTLQ